MDQTQHFTKIEAHPYHGAAHVSLDRPKPMYDPECPLCREELAEVRRERKAEERDRFADDLEQELQGLIADHESGVGHEPLPLHAEFEDD